MSYDREVQSKLDWALSEWLGRFIGCAIRKAPKDEWPPPAADVARDAIEPLSLKTEDGRFVKVESVRNSAPQLYAVVEEP